MKENVDDGFTMTTNSDKGFNLDNRSSEAFNHDNTFIQGFYTDNKSRWFCTKTTGSHKGVMVVVTIY